jgi:hypothetical protein
MKSRLSIVSIFISLSSMTAASARCYSDDCVEDRISGFFLFLPLMVWGFLVWAQEDSMKSNPEKYSSGKKLQYRIFYLIAFAVVWAIMGTLL